MLSFPFAPREGVIPPDITLPILPKLTRSVSIHVSPAIYLGGISLDVRERRAPPSRSHPSFISAGFTAPGCRALLDKVLDPPPKATVRKASNVIHKRMAVNFWELRHDDASSLASVYSWNHRAVAHIRDMVFVGIPGPKGFELAQDGFCSGITLTIV
eukprot:1315794-Amorphochlora_amoeboformis.AAC.2